MNSYLIVSGKWSCNVPSIGVSLMATSFNISMMLTTFWAHFLSIHLSGDCVLHHPSYDPKGSHFYIYDPAPPYLIFLQLPMLT